MSRSADFPTDNAILSTKLSELMQTRSGAVLRMRKLLELAGLALSEEGKVTPETSEQLTRILDRISFAIEPDYRYDGWSPGFDDDVVVFKAEYGGPINPERPAYLETKVKIDEIALSTAADGSPPAGGFESLKSEIISAAGFSNIERARLLAYAFALLENPPKPKRKKQVGAARLANSVPNNRISWTTKALPLAGAGILFGFAVFLDRYAAGVEPAPDIAKMSAAEIRYECSLITEDAFHAECLQQAQQSNGDRAKLGNSLRALPAVQ
jgi:hypothetical protein